MQPHLSMTIFERKNPKMILNYRVELCRKCYYKRTHQCSVTDSFIQNPLFPNVKPGGECAKYQPIPWLPRL